MQISYNFAYLLQMYLLLIQGRDPQLNSSCQRCRVARGVVLPVMVLGGAPSISFFFPLPRNSLGVGKAYVIFLFINSLASFRVWFYMTAYSLSWWR